MTEENKTIIEIERKEVGDYAINLLQEKDKEHSWNIHFFVEVTKNKEVLETSQKERKKTYAETTFKNLIKKYKLLAIKDGNYKFLPQDFYWKPKDSTGYEMVKINKYTNEIVKDVKSKITTFEALIRAFVHNKTGKKSVVGKYKIIDDKLIYEGSGRNMGLGQEILALRLRSGSVIGNASKLNRCGSYRRGTEAPAQRVMFDMNIPLIPFNVFEEAKLDIQKVKVVEKAQEEDFILPKLEWNNSLAELRPVEIYFRESQIKKPKSTKTKIITLLKADDKAVWDSKKNKYKKGWSYTYLDKTQLAKRHFVGAMLLQVKNKYFLFDVDRNELKYYRFNPFLAQLPNKCKTIKQAYEMLKPKEVDTAIKKGKKVLRQGEWFFIPVNKKIKTTKLNLPKNIQNGLKKKPIKKEYDLEGYSGGDIIDIKNYTYEFDKIKKKYKKQLLIRIKDYNKQAKVYQSWKKKEDEFNKKFNYFDYGGELKAGNNRPNRVGKLFIQNGIHYVTGKVEHTGREHEPITLTSWYKAIPNTATKSFTITGNID